MSQPLERILDLRNRLSHTQQQARVLIGDTLAAEALTPGEKALAIDAVKFCLGNLARAERQLASAFARAAYAEIESPEPRLQEV